MYFFEIPCYIIGREKIMKKEKRESIGFICCRNLIGTELSGIEKHCLEEAQSFAYAQRKCAKDAMCRVVFMATRAPFQV